MQAPWTLAVQVYRGGSVLQSAGSTPNNFLTKLGTGKDDGERRLEAAAKMAHELAEVLRGKDSKKSKMRYDAYVLHTKDCSYVTIGGFKAEDDPELLRARTT